MEERVSFFSTLFCTWHRSDGFSNEGAKGTIKVSAAAKRAQRLVNDETCCVEIFVPPSLELHVYRSRIKLRRCISEFQSSSRKIYLSNATKIFRIVVDKGSKLRRWRYVVSPDEGIFQMKAA